MKRSLFRLNGDVGLSIGSEEIFTDVVQAGIGQAAALCCGSGLMLCQRPGYVHGREL